MGTDGGSIESEASRHGALLHGPSRYTFLFGLLAALIFARETLYAFVPGSILESEFGDAESPNYDPTFVEERRAWSAHFLLPASALLSIAFFVSTLLLNGNRRNQLTHVA